MLTELPDIRPAQAPEPTPVSDEDRPILVATDGHAHADTAMIAAAFLAGRTGQNVHAFSVIERMASPCHNCDRPANVSHANMQKTETSENPRTLCRTKMLLECEQATRRSTIETQLSLTVGEAAEWPITIRAGTLTETAQQIITETRAQLLVIGQCRQRRPDAPADACHATEQFTRATIPIYIASPTLRGMARRVVVAMDFSETSVRAAQLAIRLSAADANVYLVHVLPHMSARDLEDRRTQLQRMAHSLSHGTDVRVESVLVLGAPAAETLGFADGIRADLIACGASSLPIYPTTRPCPPSLGRATRDLIRRASDSLLIVPGFTDIMY